MKQPIEILKHVWGYDNFRPGQIDIINGLLDGHDSLVILPTGGGKSICFQIPVLIKDGCGIVVSPLIALMNDQVEALNKKNIPAAVIHSGMSRDQIAYVMERAALNEIKFLYCSPERLNNEAFLDSAQYVNWNYLIVDEAHCISEWGHDFRPQYLEINSFKKNLSLNIPIGAFTASATAKTTYEISERLELRNPKYYFNGIFRSNISYNVNKVEQKEMELLQLLTDTSNIIYCNTRAKTEQLNTFLKCKNYNSTFYHAGLSNKERNFVQAGWIASDSQIVCSTNAFGMGINKENVRQVFHMHAPTSLEAYYQEAGRAGRDEKRADTYLLVTPHDIQDLIGSIEDNYPPFEIILEVYNAIFNYLNVGLHEGFEQKYFIDLTAIKNKTKLKFVQILSSIKILESENVWVFNQDDTAQHHVQILCNRREMDFLEKNALLHYQLLVQLLRMYGEILMYKIPISTQRITEELNINYETLISRLEDLHRMDYISWDKYKKGSSLYLVQSRLPNNFLFLNKKKILKRKEIYAEKVKHMLNFINDHSTCRQRIIGDYFGDKNISDCGICDNCKSNNFKKYKNQLKIKVLEILNERKQIPFETLFKDFNNEIKKADLKIIINELINDDRLTFNNTDTITLQ